MVSFLAHEYEPLPEYIIWILSTHYLTTSPSDISHVMSVKEKERSEDSGDADVILLANDNRHCFHIHHYQHNSLYFKRKPLLKLYRLTAIVIIWSHECESRNTTKSCGIHRSKSKKLHKDFHVDLFPSLTQQI